MKLCRDQKAQTLINRIYDSLILGEQRLETSFHRVPSEDDKLRSNEKDHSFEDSWFPENAIIHLCTNGGLPVVQCGHIFVLPGLPEPLPQLVSHVCRMLVKNLTSHLSSPSDDVRSS